MIFGLNLKAENSIKTAELSTVVSDRKSKLAAETKVLGALREELNGPDVVKRSQLILDTCRKPVNVN